MEGLCSFKAVIVALRSDKSLSRAEKRHESTRRVPRAQVSRRLSDATTPAVDVEARNTQTEGQETTKASARHVS